MILRGLGDAFPAPRKREEVKQMNECEYMHTKPIWICLRCGTAHPSRAEDEAAAGPNRSPPDWPNHRKQNMH